MKKFGSNEVRSNKRSPLKSGPPRQAGESVQAALEDFTLDHIFRWIFYVTTFGICAAIFWAAYFMRTSILFMAWIMTLLFLISIPFALFKIKAARDGYRKLRQGRDGERVVGSLLDELRRDGYRVLHDVPDAKKQSFNIDHVVIGPGGVFAIETKTFSKVGSPQEKIRYEGEELIIPGIGRGEDLGHITRQATASADFIRKHLATTTGHSVYVQPVIIFPGWYVSEPREASRSVLPFWVLNENRIFAWIGKAPPRLSREDISLYTHRLRLHMDDCFSD